MNSQQADDLWLHFLPLWQEWTSIITVQHILVAGGYGLFLKQRGILNHPTTTIMVPISDWRDATPRVTKDVDLLIGLDLIADKTAQAHMLATLTKHHFTVSELHPRWQFIKKISNHRSVIVELHAPQPSAERPQLQADNRRVKRRPSLGNQGIHARTNPEAIGCDLHPSSVTVDGIVLLLPNSFTWSVMKLTAAHQRWAIAQNDQKSADDRAFARSQAIKHAQDVCRIIAMMTRDEGDRALSVSKQFHHTPAFTVACDAVAHAFSGDQSWAPALVAEYWRDTDFALIRSTLATWFQLPQ